jgi:Flp pilus assembly pilin Flp
MRRALARVTMCRMSRTDRDDRGAGLVEYALLLALIAIVCVGALTFTGSRTSAKLSVLGEALVRDDVAGTTTPTAGGATTTTVPSATTTVPPATTVPPVTTTVPPATTVPPVTTTVPPATTTTLNGCDGPKPPKKCTGG